MRLSRVFAALLAALFVLAGRSARCQTVQHTFQGGLGWQMISAPGVPISDFTSQGITAFEWQPSISDYAETPTPPADAFHTGQGYWVYLRQDVTVTADVTQVNNAGTATIPLGVGWNQIGDPFDQPLPLSSLTLQDSSGNSTPLTTAIANNETSPLYPYDPSVANYTLLQNDTDVLQPWSGAWIYVRNPMTLSVPPPQGVNPGQGNNSFAGHWVGPGLEDPQGQLDITIDSNGNITGHETDPTGAPVDITGAITDNGVLDLEYNFHDGYPAGWDLDANGQTSINAGGDLVGSLDELSAGSKFGTATLDLKRQ